MDYQQSRAYVKDADRYAGGALDLTNIKELMKRLGNPQDQLKYVHVAGTNGKGSVLLICILHFRSWISSEDIFPIRVILNVRRWKWPAVR